MIFSGSSIVREKERKGFQNYHFKVRAGHADHVDFEKTHNYLKDREEI